MARIEGMSRGRTLVARLAFFLSRRSYGRVITPAQVYALDSRLLWLSPSLVGGCRPLELQMLLPASGWQLVSVNVVTAFGIPSEIVVAQPQP